MTGDSLGEVIRRIGRSVGLQGDLALTDAQLLERFVARRDEPAFAALVARYGPMVLGVCRRLVRDAQEAEDAFQATFLVLARKAACIQRQPLLAGWLYGVAYRTAVRLRGQTIRRRTREQLDVDLTALAAADDGADSEVRPLVHEEVGRLPDKYRSAVVLCYLEGKTNEEAALQLRWPIGSVKSRLARARDLLRTRLTRRGLTLSAGLLTTALVVNKSPASPALADATIRGAALYAAGDATAGGLISARAVGLSCGVLRTMILTKAKIVIALALSLAMLGGAGGLAYQSLAAGPGDTPKAAPMKTAAHDDRPKADKEKPKDGESKDDAEAIQGVWRVTAVETEGKQRDDDRAERIKSEVWTIKADKIFIKIGARDQKVGGPYKIDPTKKPKTLDITEQTVGGDGEVKSEWKRRAIYSLEGDVLKIWYGMSAAEIKHDDQDVGRRPRPFDLRDLTTDGGRPTELATKEGSRSTLITLKRVAPDKDGANKQKPQQTKPRDDKEAIQGLWQVSKTEESNAGAAMPFRDLRDPWRITADAIVVNSGTDEFRFTYRLEPERTPKAIDVEMAGVTFRGIYQLDGDTLKICVNWEKESKRPTELAITADNRRAAYTFRRALTREVKKKEDKPDPWGKLIKGLQAGLSIRDPDKNSYMIGETVRFVVKLRNCGDGPKVFRYEAPYPIGDDVDQLVGPSVLDADGNRVTMSGPAFSGGERGKVEKLLLPSEEIEFALPTLVIAPVTEPRVTEKPTALVKPGKYKVRYNVNFVNPDDTGNYLSTGEVEIVVRAKK